MVEQGDFVPIEGQLVEVTQLGVFHCSKSKNFRGGALHAADARSKTPAG